MTTHKVWSLGLVASVCLATAAAAQDGLTVGGRDVVALFDESNWQECDERGAARVCLRSTAVKGAREALASMTVNAPVADVAAFILNVDGYCDWVNKCVDVELVERVDDENFTYALRLSMPFPYRDRITVSRTRVEHGDDGALYLIGESAPSDTATTLDGFRASMSEGVWRLRPSPAGGTEIATYVVVDLGGGVPIGITGPLLRQSTARSARNIARLYE